jgi:hypothetical protein
MTRRNWTVTVECKVQKSVDVENCTEEEARANPWDFAVNEVETDQIDWHVTNVKEAD